MNSNSETESLIFGYTFQEILDMQQRKQITRTPSTRIGPLEPTEADFKLLAEYGMDGLEKMQYYGVIERLKHHFSNKI